MDLGKWNVKRLPASSCGLGLSLMTLSSATMFRVHGPGGDRAKKNRSQAGVEMVANSPKEAASYSDKYWRVADLPVVHL